MTGNPRVEAMRLLGGFIVSQAMGVAARLGLADLVHERPRSAAELAEACGADPELVRRLLRTLASAGVFAHDGEVVRQTELSEMLRSDVPDSIRWHAELFTGVAWPAWGDALETFRGGGPAFDRVYGSAYFDWIAAHPELTETFNRAMAAVSVPRREALFEIDWSTVGWIVDVGGASGSIAIELLTRHDHLRATVFDLPHSRESAERAIAAAGLGDRCTFAAGSFFEEVPAGADVYLLSYILHDWDDRRSTEILQVCRRAAANGSRLLLVESVIRDGDEPDWMKLLDLHMLILLGGKERTEDEWRRLLAGGGFELTSVTPGRLASVVEAAPA